MRERRLTKLIRVLLIEDHPLVRAGIRALLETISGITVVEAANGKEAIATAAKCRPDVALIGIAMPGMSGFEITQQVIGQCPATRVIIFSMQSDEEYVHRALRAGATGYLAKDARKAELELVLKSVAEGGMYLSHAVSKHVVDYLRRTREEGAECVEQLTARQKET